ncbi:hypothetical protein BDZ91DRAFT_478392 [Kalaharituber pfeilii]|nr:hypothetical protein BDZ91DRAFT_478392 [Kalaharituber pfeilii]
MVLLYDLILPEDTTYANIIRTRAKILVESSVDRTKSLYDTTVTNQLHRYWWDSNLFVHLLIEGLVEWGLRFGPVNMQLWEQVRAEIAREMRYSMRYLRDPNDGLYYRNFRLYTVSAWHLAEYRHLTGDTGREGRFDEAERLRGDQSLQKPVEQRMLAKTLLGSGGAGRAFCIAGRVVSA